MNKKSIALGAASVAIIATIAVADDADAAADVYTGTGWAISTHRNVFSLDPSRSYVVTYQTQTALTKTRKMFDRAIGQLRGLGIDITNTTTVENLPTTKCPPKNHINISLVYRPAGKGGISEASPCYTTSDNSVFSGVVMIDSEYKQLGGTWILSDKLWKNVFPHELGHALGLAHVTGVKDARGNTPAMTVPNGGYNQSINYGLYTHWDLNGFRQLVANHG